MGNEAIINEIISSIAEHGEYVGRVDRTLCEKDSINPRKHRNPKMYEATKNDISANGISQALLMRLNPNTDTGLPLLVVAGEGRFLMAEELDISHLPAKVKKLTDAEAIHLAGTENILRNDMSAIEEADFAEKKLIEYKNDLDSVASELGWSKLKLQSRLLLTRATPDVRKVLAEGDIAVGHAEILCSLTDDAQNKILPIIVNNSLTVKDTKAQVESLERDLSKACFDTQDCQGCRHNTSAYVDLFSSVATGGKCRSARCWDNKVEEQIVHIMDESAKEFRTVKRDSDVAESSIIKLVDVGDNGVGETQLSQCINCEHYGCVVSSKVGEEGKVNGDVCFNTTCHSEKVSEYKSFLADMNSTASKVESVTSEDSSRAVTKKPDSKSKPKASSETPKAIKLISYREMAKAAATDMKTAPHVIRAVSLYRVLDRSDKLVINQLSKEVDGFEYSGSNYSKKLQCLIALDDEALNKIELAVNLHYIENAGMDESFEKDERRALALTVFDHLQSDISKSWAMDEEFVGKLTKASLKDHCEQSGFDKAYTEAKGDKAFGELFKSKMDGLKKGIVEFDFNWKGWLPKSMDFSEVIKAVVKKG